MLRSTKSEVLKVQKANNIASDNVREPLFSRGGARRGAEGATAPPSGNLSPPHRGKLNNSSGNDIRGGNFNIRVCFLKLANERTNYLPQM